MILITGASGFVGTHLSKFLNEIYSSSSLLLYGRKDLINFLIPSNIKFVVHLAGESMDLDNNVDIYEANLELTKRVYDEFLLSNAEVFIYVSSIKAVANDYIGQITEDTLPNPRSDYGKSKYYSELYINNNLNPSKRVFILRPSVIYGLKSNSNFNMLFKSIKTGLPWPFGAFNGIRSFCSIYNLIFVIGEIIKENIKPGIYNVADDDSLSMNDLIILIASSLNIKPRIICIPKNIILFVAKIGDYFNLPVNTKNLNKITSSLHVSNEKLKLNLKKPLPVSSVDGITSVIISLNFLGNDPNI